jgi:peptidoglycan hydrolase-like protein with peptidoglycan-binding domain
MADKVRRRLAWSVSGAMLMAALSLPWSAPAMATTTASCTSASLYTVSHWYVGEIPSIGWNTKKDNCLLGLGNQSVGVSSLQHTLRSCYGRKIATDGIFGPETQAALQYAQRAEHIPADGVYGPQTRDHIRWVDVYNRGCGRL